MEKKTIKVVAAIIRKDNTVFATQREGQHGVCNTERLRGL